MFINQTRHGRTSNAPPPSNDVSIKPQARPDGKAQGGSSPEAGMSFIFNAPGDRVVSFRRHPEPQRKRDQGDAADPGKPEPGEPDQALRQRPLLGLARRQ